MSEEVQRHAETNSTKHLFRKIRNTIRKFKPRYGTLNDQQDVPITELDKIALIWKDYYGNLHADTDAFVDALCEYEKEYGRS